MPAPKRSSSASSSKSPSRRASSAGAASAGRSAASGARSAGSSDGRSSRGRSAKAGGTATSSASRARASSAASPAKAASAGSARSTRKAAAGTAKSARSGTRSASTPTAARRSRAQAKAPATTTKASATKTRTTGTRRASSGGSDGIASLAEQLARGAIKPRDLVVLTRERIQEALDEAAERGRVTRRDANQLVSELVRRGRGHGDLFGELEGLVGRGRRELQSVTRRARRVEGVERLVRGADRVRRSAGVGSSFPITGYDELNASQVQRRIKGLDRAQLRKVLTYERSHANRKTVVAALEKALG